MTHKWKQPHATSNRGLWYKHTGPHIYTDHGLWHGFTRTHILTNHGKLISFLDQTYPRIMVYAPSPDVKNFSLNNKIISTGDTFIIKRKIFNVGHLWVYDKLSTRTLGSWRRSRHWRRRSFPGCWWRFVSLRWSDQGPPHWAVGRGPVNRRKLYWYSFSNIQFQIMWNHLNLWGPIFMDCQCFAGLWYNIFFWIHF